MKLKILLLLAWRNLWRNYRRTSIMLLAIVVGVWAMIFMSALMRGMVDQMLTSALQTFVGHIQIHQQNYRRDPSIVNSMQAPSAELKKALDNAEAWAERVRVPAVVTSERETRGVTLMGIDPKKEARLSFLAHNIFEGRYLEKGEKGVIIGEKLAFKLHTRLGKRVVLMSQDGENAIVEKGVRIIGIYRADLSATEERFIFMDKRLVQTFLGMGSDISEIELIDKDFRNLQELKSSLELSIVSTKNTNPKEQIDNKLNVTTWAETESYLAAMLSVMDGFVLVWMVVVFIALSFGLVNTLVMAVFERTREIGLMLSLGLRPSSIMIQILIESIFLLLLGLLVGTFLAWISVKPLESGIDVSVVAEGMAMMGVGTTLYPSLTIKDILTANAIVVTLGLLASLLPAWRASKLRPIEAMNVT